MPTNAQRFQAIGDALVNGTATPQQLDKFGEALYAETPEAWAALTQQKKLEIAVKKCRQWANYTTRQYAEEQQRRAISAPDDQLPEV